VSTAPPTVIPNVAQAVPVVSGIAGQPEVTLDALRRFSVDEYHQLIKLGILAEDGSCELLKGLVVLKMGKNRRHSLVTRRLREFLEPLLTNCYVDSQEPLIALDSEPEPDVYVVRGKPEDYQDQQPSAKDVLLVIEVAEATLRQDRVTKKWIYAEAGIPIYWIVNLIDRQIEIYTQPSGPAKQPDYAPPQIVPAEGTLAVVIDGREVGRLAVKDILP
jgi:Uma2 family endonuclease